MSGPADLGDGIWRWALRHPEWHPRTALGAEVAGGTVLGHRLEPLLALAADRVLVTHGPPALRDCRRALEDALAADPWYHRSS